MYSTSSSVEVSSTLAGIALPPGQDAVPSMSVNRTSSTQYGRHRTVVKACHTCRHLRRCKSVTLRKVEDRGSCQDWIPTDATDLSARQTIISEFGLSALRFTLPYDFSVQRRRK